MVSCKTAFMAVCTTFIRVYTCYTCIYVFIAGRVVSCKTGSIARVRGVFICVLLCLHCSLSVHTRIHVQD